MIGEAFDSHSGGAVRSIEAEVHDDSATLARHCWGHYLVFCCSDASGAVRIMRAPFGSLPCLYVEMEDGLLVGSDLAMLALGGWKSQGVAWDEVACHLLARDIARSFTCLTGVRELRGGECLRHDRTGVRTASFWSPWNACAAEDAPADRAQAALRIRRAVVRAAQSETANATRPLLMLSGGLDSSIVGASLVLAGRAFAGLNLVSADASGDERRYARLAAEAFGVPLHETKREIGNVDLTVSEAAHLPRPSARGFLQDSTRLTLAAAHSAGCDCVIDGGGGDNVFCSLQSVTPVAEALRHADSWGEGPRAARAMAELTGASVPTVLRLAAWRALRPRAPRWPIDASYLGSGVANDLRDCLDHPWLIDDTRGRPGTASHIGLLVAAQNWIESSDPQATLATASPLLAQPVVEACLAAPSWWWFADGRNRALARHAFAELLPTAIARRRSKASPDSFVAELFERNRPIIRAMLLDGRLAAQRLVDRNALEAVLTDRAPARDTAYRRIMRLVDVEAWLRNWS
jgi:asparagine synthase (glutamine-hydrolysing)